MVSLQTKVLERVVRVIGVKRRLAKIDAVADDPAKLDRLVKTLRAPDLPDPPRRIRRSWEHERIDIDGFPLQVLTRAHRPARTAILYLHGGGYMFGPALFEWSMAASIAESADCDLGMFIYPKAPEHQAPQTVEVTLRAYDELARRYGKERVVPVGTSAGGGLCVVLMGMLRDRGSPQPPCSVLVSPGVDMVVEEDVSHLERGDVLLSLEFARGAGALYRGDLDLVHPYVSPTYGDLSGLAPMHVFAGTKEILYPMLETFVGRVHEADGVAHLIVGKGQQHTWPTAPTPEGRTAVRQIVAIIRAELEERESEDDADRRRDEA